MSTTSAHTLTVDEQTTVQTLVSKYGDSGRGCGRNNGSRGSGRGRGHTHRENNAQVQSDLELSDVPGVSKEAWNAINSLLKQDKTSSADKLSGKTPACPII